MIRILTRAAALLAILSPSLLMAVTVTVQVTPSRCGQANGVAVIATANGGIPPYAFSWSTGATTASISGLLAGDYTVTVTDGLSNSDQTTATVTDIPNLAAPWSISQRPDCGGSCSGWASISEADLQGTAPYTYDWPNPYILFGQANLYVRQFAVRQIARSFDRCICALHCFDGDTGIGTNDDGLTEVEASGLCSYVEAVFDVAKLNI